MPITPRKALQIYGDVLTNYEQTEILNKTIYFIGEKAAKIKGSLMNDYNFGYDDENGDYKIVMKDHIDYRYEVISLLGQGSFGQVLKCYDHKHKEKWALKIIRNKKKFHDQGLVEVKVLEALKENDPNDDKNIIRIKNNFVFRNHIWISFELLSINMYDLIKENNFEGFSMNPVRKFAIQILHGLKYMKQLSIIHWDLKPENILVTNKSKNKIKIIDFGSSCFEDERIYTYIQSRFYRAPEIILGIQYTSAIDMWSFAWIVIELFIGFPIFPGESENDQLARIMEYKGIPPINIMEEATRSGFFFDDNLDPIPIKNSRGGYRKPCTKSLTKLLDWNDKNFIRFLDSWLHWDPELRLTPEEALCHDWILEGMEWSQLLYKQHRLLESQFPSSSDVGNLDGKKQVLSKNNKIQIDNYIEICHHSKSNEVVGDLSTPKSTNVHNFNWTHKLSKEVHDALEGIYPMNKTNKLKIKIDDNIFYRK